MNDTILKVENLTVSFPAKKGWSDVVNKVNFSIERGQSLGLVGESGSGKSMTALAIMQLLPYGAYVDDNSKVIFQDLSLLDCSEQEMRNIRGTKIGMIFQDSMSAFNPVLRISQQMDEVLKKLKLGSSQRKERALSLLDEVGIKDVKRTYHSYPHELSGGMRQRAMIAMAICGEPQLIIADEPTTALDVTIQAQVLDLLLEMREKENLSLLFITHDLAVISKIAYDVVVIQRGQVVEHSSAKTFFRDPKDDYSKKLLSAIPSSEVRQKHTPGKETILKVDNLKVYFPIGSNWFSNKKQVKAVDGIEFSIAKGETLALVGESGSGKTTAAKAIIRLIKATEGSIHFDDCDLSTLSYSRLRPIRRDIQIIFQDPYVSLNPRRVVADSILEGIQAQKVIKKRKLQLERVDELLIRVGLSPDHKWRYPHEFSGGERQRICIARALALRPKLLILDEPTSALDVSIQMQILELLEELQKQYNMSYLLITHNISVVAFLSHYLAVMYHGRIVEKGQTETILQNPQDDYTKSLLSAVPTIQGVFND